MRLQTPAAVASTLALTACGTPERIAGPNWVGDPSGAVHGDYSPEWATRRPVAAWVALRCEVASEQRLGRCEVLNEQPLGLGFGDAALRMREGFKVSTRAHNLPYSPQPGSKVDISVIFFPPINPRDCEEAKYEAFEYLASKSYVEGDLNRKG